MDLLTAGALANPYPAYNTLRANDPVHWHNTTQCWVLTRYADCLALLKDSRRFAEDPARAGLPADKKYYTLQNLDPPDHEPLRALFADAYRTRDWPVLIERLQIHSDFLLRRLSPTPELLHEYVIPLAIFSLADLLGVNTAELTRAAATAETIVRSMDAYLDPDLAQHAAAARRSLSNMARTWYDGDHLDHGMISQLKHTDTSSVADEWIIHTLRIFITAGYTTAYAAAAGVLASLHRQGVSPADVPETGDAIEELLRYDGPVHAVARICAEDTEIGGRPIRRGQAVVAMLGAANRDPDRFARPDELVFDRRPNLHLAFGWGIHYCLGSLMAKRFLRVVLAGLRSRFPRLSYQDPVRYRPQATLRCPELLRVR
jgi:cytochrome P450